MKVPEERATAYRPPVSRLRGNRLQAENDGDSQQGNPENCGEGTAECVQRRDQPAFVYLLESERHKGEQGPDGTQEKNDGNSGAKRQRHERHERALCFPLRPEDEPLSAASAMRISS